MGSEMCIRDSSPPSSAPAAFFPATSLDETDFLPALSISQNTPPSTQNSIHSSQHPLTKTNKRSYEDELEDELDAYFSEVEAEDHDTLVAKRAFVQPRNRAQKMVMGGGQVAIVGEDGDFEEAPFLAPMDIDG